MKKTIYKSTNSEIVSYNNGNILILFSFGKPVAGVVGIKAKEQSEKKNIVIEGKQVAQTIQHIQYLFANHGFMYVGGDIDNPQGYIAPAENLSEYQMSNFVNSI